MRGIRRLGWVVVLLLQAVAMAGYAAPASPFLLLEASQMAAYKAAYAKGSASEVKQVKALLAEADQVLATGPYAVTFKKQLPPSGNKHDYMSQAPYWWPDPTKPDGKPYIQKDGLKNPESTNLKDSESLTKVCEGVKALGLAYYFTGEEKYAARASKLLRVFFLDADTRMNPNLSFGQGIPGMADGRSYGIIESRHLTEIPDALALMNGAKSIDANLVSGLKSWYKQFTQWLLTSQIGREEGNNKNNHGTFYDVQVVDYLLFTGDKAQAKQHLENQTVPRLASQIEPDGSQPLELARTRPWNYTTMNLQGWVELALLAPKAGVDLWHYATSDGRGLRQAVAWFRPYLLQQKKMERPDVAPTNNNTILALYNHAGRIYPELEVAKVFALYPDYVRVPWAF
ncbi:alginate lyase family protein [Hymenobacter jejuensis]|nr:alginate lyase family protein [Hymenobacter jejuensis]